MSANKEGIQIELLDMPYPAIEGMKELNTPIKYVLPEVNLKKRKEVELKERVRAMAAAAVFPAWAFCFSYLLRCSLCKLTTAFC